MNEIELKMMKGMVDILNEASEAYRNGNPILTDEQFSMRSNDLVCFEAETGVVLLNSPNCTTNVESIVKTLEIKSDTLKECQDINDIVEFANQKELIAYIDVNGLDMIITYVDGRIDNIKVSNIDEYILNMICNLSIPYCASENINCDIKGKVVCVSGKSIFYATEAVRGGLSTLRGNFDKMIDLGFDVVPNWNFTTLNSKSFQNSVDYIFEHAEEDNIPCNGIVFKLNDIEYSKMMSVMSCDACNGIIIRKKGNSTQ